MEIRSFADLLEAIQLHDALWVATACPRKGLACDAAFLDALDRDGNGRIVSDDLRYAVKWTAEMLDEHRGIDEASEVLELSALSKQATSLRRAAETILEATSAEKKKSISLAQVRESAKALRASGINGDGIVAPETITDAGVADAVRTILSVLDAKENLAGKKGIDAAMLEAFRKRRDAGLARLDAESALMVWGDASIARAKATRAARDVLDEYFVQCRLVAAQPEAGEQLRLPADHVRGAMGDREALAKAARALPIAPPRADGTLRFAEVVRGPAYEAIETFRREVVVPVLGEGDVLPESAWRDLRAKSDAILAWIEEGEKDRVIGLGAKLRQLTGAQLDAIGEAIAKDVAHKPTLDAIASLEKLILHQRWLLRFANNFIAMPELFDHKRSALFQRGTLTLGGRHFALAVEVPDRAAHAALAESSNTFVAYVKIEPAGKPPFEVAVPVTAGTSAGITVGKRGVFRDPSDVELDASVVQIVPQPVSLWEAAIAPFARVGRFVSSKLEELGKTGDAAMESTITSTEARVREERARHDAAAAAPTPAAAPAAAAPASAAPGASAGALGGVIASGGLALAAVGSSAAFMMNQLQGMSLIDVVRAAVAIAAIVMVPSAFLGWLKLRKRNLAILLEGAGWALNDRLMLTRRLGLFFTRRPPRPEGSRIDRSDLVPVIARSDDEASSTRGRITVAVIAGLILAAYWTHAWWWPHLRHALPLLDHAEQPASETTTPAP
ncbi:Hypothetical protein DB32_007285 [Sandaracinus amylolyticus]|uniref:EF-hand domain-containing protein n=1 Tax=Sandaracinus amylolyticus TaxID=927083 RepID=A0A0F6W8J4_9BACT|nr:Hypothetical protein DB32_007285 [Sandaracinus amylolyticus]